MKEYKVKRYQKEDFAAWNAFVSVAKNATFLFNRDFMDYHSDRFQDYSLMVFDGEKLVAILPANRVEDAVFSHYGLTYGGLVLGQKAKLSSTISIFRTILKFLNENAIQKLTIKMLPKFYDLAFSDELEYCLFITDSKIIRADSLSVIDLSKPNCITNNRMQTVRKGKEMGLIIKEESSFQLFWDEVLIPNLVAKHQVKPVHSVEEITKLNNLFPKNIRHFNVYEKEQIVAGTTLFLTDNVVHSQYISGKKDKNHLGSLDFLYHHLITEIFKDKEYFDFGISNENHGRNINEGLLFWKESFGAKTVVQPFHEVKTANYYLLDDVLI